MQPFSQYELRQLFDTRKIEISDYIKFLSDEDVMSGQDETIANNMYEKYRFIPIEVDDELIENRKISRTKIERMNPFPRAYGTDYIYVDGVEVTCQFPFKGDNLLFTCRPSTFSTHYPEINLSSNYFTISSSETLDTMNKPENKDLLFNKINNDLKRIKEFIVYCNSDIAPFNNSLKNYTLQALKTRKEKADKFLNISKMLEIPITRSNPKVIEEIKIERKIVPLIKTEPNSKPEYSISDDIYNDIIEMIKHQGSTFERTPKLFNKFKEEELRDVFLSSLNGIFKGKANGECFRNNGKTDISIEYENRAAFVAECKFWGGKNVLESALNQLQSYTTWRDNKLCLIMFSKNKDFFKVIQEIKESLPAQQNYISLKEIDKNEFEYKVKSKNNEEQILKIRVFAFNLVIDESRGESI